MPQDDAASPNPAASAGVGWFEKVAGLLDRRKKTAAPFVQQVTIEGPSGPIVIPKAFEGGIEEMLERGLVDVEPQGDRILLRAVLPTDAGVTQLLSQDSRRLACMEVIAIGPACRKWWDANDYTEAQRLVVGDFVWVLTTVCDRLAVKDQTVRLMSCRVEYIANRIVLKKPRA